MAHCIIVISLHPPSSPFAPSASALPSIPSHALAHSFQFKMQAMNACLPPSFFLPPSSAFLCKRDRILSDVPCGPTSHQAFSTPRYAASTIKRVNPADYREKTTVLLFKHALYNAECSPCVRSCLIDAGRSLHAAATLSRFSPRGMKARSHESVDPYIL